MTETGLRNEAIAGERYEVKRGFSEDVRREYDFTLFAVERRKLEVASKK